MRLMEEAINKKLEGTSMWMFTLITFKNGKAEIVKSFSKPAKDSDVKQQYKKKKKKSAEKVKPTRKVVTKSGEVDLFGDN